jgi:hypothetical protein
MNARSSTIWPDIGTKLMSMVLVREDGCWAFTGSLNGWGYGKMRWEGKHYGAHRVSWEFHREPIPKGLCVLHHCDRPWCVNPDHLFCGTDQDNVADMIAKGRADYNRRGERQGGARLTEAQVREIRALLAKGSLYRWQIAKRFGVCEGTISDIKLGKTWAWLAGP